MRLPETSPPIEALMQEFDELPAPDRYRFLQSAAALDPKGRYLHWDQVRRRQPPDGLTRRTWWFTFAHARRIAGQQLPLLGKGGLAFWYCRATPVLESLHRIDREMAGHILLDEQVVSSGDRSRYLVNSLMEESIRSSQLEGANTTRLIAQEMLRTRRAPRDRSERMIFNNFAAMQTVERWARDDVAVSAERLLHLHEIVTDGTLDDPADSGRLQTPEELRVAVVASDGSVVHEPPPAGELPQRMERLCRFANGDIDDGYLHPVVRAILCHFMIGYDHPFVDGNGRTARALFYWTMLRSGYWLAAYLSISNLLRTAPSQYSRAYEYVHADSNDATYFLIHQLSVIERAVDGLHEYIERQMQREAQTVLMLRGIRNLNHRQQIVMGRAAREPWSEFTVSGHETEFRVSAGTAHSDLTELLVRGFLTRERSGRRYIFRPAPDLQERLGPVT